jgi:hypothetical protein
MLYLNWGDPLTVERLMETVKAFDERIIDQPAGPRPVQHQLVQRQEVYREAELAVAEAVFVRRCTRRS